MPVELITPAGLAAPEMYRQVSVATGSRHVFVAGQIAVDVDGGKVGLGDLAAQAEQACLNVGAALSAAGATFDDVAKMTIYVTSWSPDKLPLLAAGLGRAAERVGMRPGAPTSVIGVSVLFDPDFLVEIEVVAVLP